MIESLFWIFFFIVIYTFPGYAILLWALVKLKHLFRRRKMSAELPDVLPHVCLFVTACDEVGHVVAKVENSFQLNYPKEKIQYLWLTDGSGDGTPDRLRVFPEIQVEHLPERNGKIHAMNRGMQFVDAPIVVFSDANTMLARDALLEIVRHFQVPKVGCVSGEKRILEKPCDSMAAIGESFYWRFESRVKALDAELSSAIGAAGELFAIRRELYEPVDADTLLDDFVISMRLVEKGHRIAYAPAAFAVETASLNLREEYKRKTRIAAGGIQSLARLYGLLNPVRYGWLSWQFFSHKVLRWTLAPIAVFGLLPVNLCMVAGKQSGLTDFFDLFFGFQFLIYLLAGLGWLFEKSLTRYKLFFLPAYFFMMNYSTLAGGIRYFMGRQKVAWEKSRRA
ncbi:glycosyltransferase family 2 protein [Gaoshiqia sediminis]|uniref:Glycosyltransferase family 2 protein n=1 Tax=Gaoshiqia sediminis TaxID=2986998 RepID=A0AA41Y751_9BACT|nr:glycosyltransferase family 2 protein [Gaoshiqia sediminis]MCW0482347.1 glycosyltransferase family 2 protein [Gaoshiqia sediminis]